MPGSANFVGEFYILNGLFDAKIVFAFVAISGVAMSAYYALRLYQRTMHNRRPEGLESREISLRDGLVLVPLVLCILGLALYPQLILKRTDTSVANSVAATEGPSGRSPKTLSTERPLSIGEGAPPGRGGAVSGAARAAPDPTQARPGTSTPPTSTTPPSRRSWRLPSASAWSCSAASSSRCGASPRT
jgi:hypothetical protein